MLEGVEGRETSRESPLGIRASCWEEPVKVLLETLLVNSYKVSLTKTSTSAHMLQAIKGDVVLKGFEPPLSISASEFFRQKKKNFFFLFVICVFQKKF